MRRLVKPRGNSTVYNRNVQIWSYNIRTNCDCCKTIDIRASECVLNCVWYRRAWKTFGVPRQVGLTMYQLRQLMQMFKRFLKAIVNEEKEQLLPLEQPPLVHRVPVEAAPRVVLHYRRQYRLPELYRPPLLVPPRQQPTVLPVSPKQQLIVLLQLKRKKKNVKRGKP